jgi:hypothetical protein
MSIFIQSYVNIKLHVSTLLDTNNTQGMQLGRFKNRTPARFEYTNVHHLRYSHKIQFSVSVFLSTNIALCEH